MIAEAKLAVISATIGWALIIATYTPTDIATLIGALGIFAGILFNGYVAVKAANAAAAATAAASAAKDAADSVVGKVVEVSAKADKIEAHVNGATTKADAMIAAQEIQLAMLRDVIADKDRTAATLAQAKATTEAVKAAFAVPIQHQGSAPLPVEHLKAIETHTADTAANTAKTDRTIDAVKDTLEASDPQPPSAADPDS